MNLTVEKALESISGQSESMIRLAESVNRLDLIEEIAAVQENINGMLSVVGDLSACQESLELNGYSEEWFALVNEGNRFVALTNLEMPKFFGTSETKRVACEGAIIDTIAIWLKKAGEFLKKLFELVTKGCRALLQYWGATPTYPTIKRVFDYIDKVTDGMQPKQAVISVEIPDIRLIHKYCANLFAFCQELYNKRTPDAQGNQDAFISFISACGGTGTYLQDVMSQLGAIAQDIGIQTDRIVDVGFSIDANGMKFIDVSAVPPITVNIADAKELQELDDSNKAMLGLFDNIKKQISVLIFLLQKNQRLLQDYLTVLKANNNANDTNDIRTLQSQLSCIKILLETIQRCNVQYTQYNQAFRNYLLRIEAAVKNMRP